MHPKGQGDLVDWLPLPPALRSLQLPGLVSLKRHILPTLSVMELEFHVVEEIVSRKNM